MPPQIALLLYILFLILLLRIDIKRASTISRALWIPLIWIIIVASRPVSLWLNPEPIVETELDYLSGNLMNRTVFIVLIAIGALILIRRKNDLFHLLNNNWMIIMLLAYCGLSTFWSDFPLVSSRRFSKEIGNLIMVLVILTDTDPAAAVKTVIRRCSYVLVPLSIVLIKYFPVAGKRYGAFTGEVEFIGAATSKNMLGILCGVCGIFFVWNLLTMIKKIRHIDKRELFIDIAFLIMISWLLIEADSLTSWLLFIMAICFMIGLSFVKRNVRYIGIFLIIIISSFLIIQMSFDIIKNFVTDLGRDITFTGRTDLWKDLLIMDTNPLIGTGYESFWLGNRMAKIWNTYWWHPNQAHNGYLEIYLNLGLIGLILLAGVIFSAYRKIRKTLLADFDEGIFRMAFLIVVLFHNITEASFKADSFLWIIFLLIAMDISLVSRHQRQGELVSSTINS